MLGLIISAMIFYIGLSYDILYRVIKGKITGERNTKGSTKAVFEKLLELGIINELPQGLK